MFDIKIVREKISMKETNHRAVIHKDLASGRWATLSPMEQLGNIGSEVGRALRRKKENDVHAETLAVYRALDLIDLTIADEKWRTRLKELLRMREVLCDYFFGDNTFHITEEILQKEFLYYGIAARAQK